MPSDLDDERKGLTELIAAHKRYLREVKLQAARQGMHTPPHILTEIERVQGELAQLEAAVATPVSNDLVKALDDAGRWQIFLAQAAEQMGKVREEVKEDMAQLLAAYREDVHRAVMGIYTRIVGLEDTIETDRGARVARQEVVDGELKGIRNNQTFWKRVGMVAALVTLGIVIGVWVL